MKPNQLGGQTLEDKDIPASFASLAADGHSETADRLSVFIDPASRKREEFDEAHPDIDPRQLIRVAGNMYMTASNVRRSFIDTLDLNPEDTALVIESVRKAAKGKLDIGKDNKEIARRMLEEYEGRKNAIQKLLARIGLS